MQTPEGPSGTAIPPPQYPIESVDNALSVLLMFQENKRLRLADVARALDVANSTAHRLMAMLAYRGFVVRDEGSKLFSAGPSLLQVGLAVVSSLDIRAAARPTLERLCDELGETIHLVTLEGTNVRFLDAAEPDRALRVAPRTGRVLPAHCTSVGKALLAELSSTELRALYPQNRLNITTGRSIATRPELEKEIEVVRARGYATNEEESEEGVGSVGVVVRGPAHQSLAGISVAAPVSRLAASGHEAVAAVLIQSARALGESFGLPAPRE